MRARLRQRRVRTVAHDGASPIPDRIDRDLLALESRSRWVVAAIVSVALVGLGLVRVRLGVRPTYLGVDYARLAADPFHPAADNPVAHRILTPLVSHLIGLRGPFLIYTNLLVVLALIAAGYLWFRARGHLPLTAVLGASTLALSMVCLTTLHFGGYTDALTYLLVFGSWWARRRAWASALLFFLAALNHESAWFLAPWWIVVLARERNGGRDGWTRAFATFGVSALAYAGACALLPSTHAATAFSPAYYARPLLDDPLHWFRAAAPHGALGVAAAFNLYWAFALLAVARRAMNGARGEALVLALPIPLALLQLFVAYDVTRLATLAFMSVVLGCEELLRTNGFGARRWALPLAVANFFIPQVSVAMGVVSHMGAR
ncbi:MAG TPA: hypothetical protein VLV15_04825 [Dongiaceae bacterium]|nr:hypothetical protein [Dongiaceae bacterium]